MASPDKVRPLPTVLQRIHSFAKKRVLIVGDLVADHYIYGQTERVSREAPVLVVRYEDSEVKLGGAGNAAANARTLGGTVTAVGALGHDEMGRELKRQFKSSGIRLLAAVDDALVTETKTRILAGGMGTTRQQMLRLDKGSRGTLPPRLRMEVARLVSEGAKGVDAVVVSDYGAGSVGHEVRLVLQRLAQSGLPVCVDSRYQLRAFGGPCICKPNEPELEALTGLPVGTEKELIYAGRAALKILSCDALVVTRGRNGIAIFDESGDVELIPAHGAREAVDVTGAGDTVIAALALGLASGATLVEASKIANVAGALVVQKQGTATVTLPELALELGETP